MISVEIGWDLPVLCKKVHYPLKTLQKRLNPFRQGHLRPYEVSDGTAFRVAGVRLKKMRGSGLRCDITGRTFTFFFLVH